MKIREAAKKDRNVLRSLFVESLKQESKLNDDINLNGGVKHIQKSFSEIVKDGKYFLAEKDGNVIGFIGGKIEKKSEFYKTRKIGAIYDLFVKKEYRNMGIGTELVKIFISWLKASKIRAVELDVSPKNFAAKELYEKLGFKESNTQMRKKI